MEKISLLGALSIGVGGMVGGGIFAVLGEAISLAHGATFIAFFLAGIVALLTAYAYTKLSLFYRDSGGTVVFIDNAFAHNLLSGSVNFMLWLSYLVTISLYASAFASYGETFFTQKSTWLHHLLICVAILLPSLINLVSATFVSRSESFIVALKVALLIVVIGFGFLHIDTSRLDLSAAAADPFSLIVAGMIIFVAYEGFELIANASHQIERPERNIPRAFYGSVLFVITLYVLISIVTVGGVDEASLMEAKDYALALAAKPSLGAAGFTLVAVAALFSTFSAINATIYGNARLGYFLAKEGIIPTFLSKKKGEIPIDGVIVTTLLSLLLANTIDLTQIAIIGSAGFLLIFSIVNIAALRLHEKIGANVFVLVVASLLSIFALIALLTHTYATDPHAVWIFVAFIFISILFESSYGYFYRKQLFCREY